MLKGTNLTKKDKKTKKNAKGMLMESLGEASIEHLFDSEKYITKFLIAVGNQLATLSCETIIIPLKRAT
jgi:hypothetical protein